MLPLSVFAEESPRLHSVVPQEQFEWLGFREGIGVVGEDFGVVVGMRVGTFRRQRFSWTAFELNVQLARKGFDCRGDNGVGLPEDCVSNTGILDIATRFSLTPKVGSGVWLGLGVGLLAEDNTQVGPDTDPAVGLMVSPSIEYELIAAGGLTFWLELRSTLAVTGDFSNAPYSLTGGLIVGINEW